MDRVRILILLVLLAFVLSFFSGCSKESEFNKLENNWEYLIGSQEDSIITINTENFKLVNELDHLERLLPNSEGFLWLKNTFTLPKNLESTEIALLLGRITMADKTYLNGELIGTGGSFPPNFFSNWNEFRFFPLSKGTLETNSENNQLIKIYMSGEW